MRPYLAFSATLMLSLLFVHASSVSVVAQKKSGRLSYGSIQISTNPPGFPILINDKPVGETAETGRSFDLEPGAYSMEILFSKDDKWAKEFIVVDGKKICIALTYRLLPPVQDETRTIPDNPGNVEQGIIEGTICDCEIVGAGRFLPRTTLPPRKPTPKKP